jgi:hypothetical protein
MTTGEEKQECVLLSNNGDWVMGPRNILGPSNILGERNIRTHLIINLPEHEQSYVGVDFMVDVEDHGAL